MVTIEHIDPRNGRLVSGLCNEFNEILSDHSYNSRKTDRFVPYRVCDYPAPVTFGDVGEFLIGGEWVVCEFGGPEWWEESNAIGNSCTTGGRTSGKVNIAKMPKEAKSRGGSANTPAQLESRARNGRKGLSQLSYEDRQELGRASGKKTKEMGIGVHAQTKEEKSALGKASGSQKWMCTVTGFITNAGALTSYQKKRGIDTSNRVRVE